MLVQILSSLMLALPLGAAVAPSPQGEAALEAGRAAVKRGDSARAQSHFQRALASAHTRADAALALGALATDAGDVDRLAVAALIHGEASVTARGGGAAAPRGAWTLEGLEVDVSSLGKRASAARVRLANSLLSLAKEREAKGARAPEELLTAAWARRFALDLVQRSPLAHKAMQRGLKPSVSTANGAHVPVVKALDRIGARALATGEVGIAVRAGRILRGLGVQADFTDLRGQRPNGMAKWRAKGADLLAKARDRQGNRGEEPWTVEELEWLSSEEGESFTRSFSSFGEPGVAVSPRGYYRIESDCGYETLLAVAQTIEDHHVRLANYFGEDPFVEDGDEVVRQGLIRIVPDPSGLEAEGAPFFWVGGFQSGDTTVVRLAAGTVEGLGRTLTHELTHRFDGALHRGIPAWLAEGRAVWTGAAYAEISDVQFKENYASHGGMLSVQRMNLLAGKRLRNVLSGEPADYRHNYTAGFGLYVFLSTWFPGDSPSFTGGEPVFAEQLRAYEDLGRHPSKPRELLEEFLEFFCDGEKGRPSTLEEFERLFAEFVHGFNPRDPEPHAKRYLSHMPSTGGRTWIYDEPTWTWDWVRAEPTFGQSQARVAGQLILEHGKAADAVRALAWARAVDGYDPRTAGFLAEALAAVKSPSRKQREAAWVVQHERNGEPFASRVNPGFARARLGPFPGDVEPMQQCLVELEAVGLALIGVKARAAAQRVFGDAERIAGWAGLPLAPWEGLAGAAEAASSGDTSELHGWLEEELTRVDKTRPPGLYFIEDDGTVLLGRDSARKGSGRFDRRGGGLSFVRASRWMLPGTYRLKTRVNFTTSFGTALIVVGWTDRGRNVRLELTAGDFEYAIGETDKEPKFDALTWRFDGMRTREGGLHSSVGGGAIGLSPASSSVEVELLVTGPVLNAWIAGQFVGSYNTVDGAPIEGYIGLGTLRGAVAVAQPLVERLDREPVTILDLASGNGPSFDKLRNVSVFFADEIESPSNGALVLWIPADSKSASVVPDAPGDEGGALRAVTRARRSAAKLLRRMERNGVAQPLVVAFPKHLKAKIDLEDFGAALRAAASETGGLPRVVFHNVMDPSPAEGQDLESARFSGIDQGRRWLFFVDGFGVARTCQSFTSAAAIGQGAFEHWLTVFRDHGQPERKLPPVSRGSDDESD